jgi:hypothetical protein
MLSTTTTSTTSTKKLTIIMAPSACNQVMSDGSDLEGIRILFQDHLIPEFIPLSKVIQVNYNGVIDNITVIDLIFFDTFTKDKLTTTALDDLKAIIANLVVNKSSNDPTSKAGTDGKAKFLELPFKWKDYTGLYHTILSAKDLTKSIQASIAAPHSSHSFYEKELVLYIPTSGLFCSRESTPDCKDLSKILTKAPPALTKAKVEAITAVSVSGAADAIAN